MVGKEKEWDKERVKLTKPPPSPRKIRVRGNSNVLEKFSLNI